MYVYDEDKTLKRYADVSKLNESFFLSLGSYYQKKKLS